MVPKKIYQYVAVGLIGLAIFSCGDSELPKVKFGPKETTDLVIIFKKGVTQESINYFEENVIAAPHEDGRGNWPLPGIGPSYQFDENENRGMGINFLADANEAQREYVKSRIRGSEIVFETYENVKPTDIWRP